MGTIPSASGVMRSLSRKGMAIIGVDLVLLVILLNILLFNDKENTGLALMTFIEVLLLTEAVHVTVTVLLIPLLAVGFSLLEVEAGFKFFANLIIFSF